MSKESLSVVIPCFNEEEVLSHSISEIVSNLDKLINDNIISSYQIVLTNNGSTDNTLEVMLSLKKIYKEIKIIDLRNNFGYQSSISAGLFNSDGDIIISIDADLQDDHLKIKEMIELYHKGYDLVLGIRDNRKSDNFFKRVFSQGFYFFIEFLGIKSEYNHGDFRLMSRDLVLSLEKYPERNRYLRGLVLTIENKYAKVFYERKARKFGETKFKPIQLISLALDGITSFSIKPIRFVFLIGLLMFFFSLVFISFVLYVKFFNNELPLKGWTSTLAIILFFGGVQNISLGIIGEYLAKTYTESKKRPLYVIRKIYE